MDRQNAKAVTCAQVATRAPKRPKHSATQIHEPLINPALSTEEADRLRQSLDNAFAKRAGAALPDHASSDPEMSRMRRLLCTPDELHNWLTLYTTLRVPRQAVCPGHHAPFDYLAAAYLEPAKDIIVWAPRGGGKTRLAAIATMLDLLHKPGCAIRILGGSLEQSLRLWEHLLPDLSHYVGDELDESRLRARRVALANRSTAAVLTQSQRAVRGLRVQKMRCDEVELFKPEIWEAAQLVTKSLPHIRGSIEAISTLHEPFGLMNRIIEQSGSNGVSLIRWCLLDVLEKCPPQRDCGSCLLWDECRGVAKEKCDGFVSIDDAVAMKRRVSRDTWEAEMLCRRPSVRGCVFPNFDPELHVREDVALASDRALDLSIDFGFSNPFVCLWLATSSDGVVYAVDEYIQPQQTIAEHIEQMRSRTWGAVRRVYCDPAGAGRNGQTAASDVTCLRDAGYLVKYKSSRIVDGLELIRAALCPAWGRPGLFVHPRCTRLIRALRSYHYAPDGSELPLKDGEHDHLIDALRYFFINHTRPIASPPRRY